MEGLSIDEVVSACGGTPYYCQDCTDIQGISIDSRKIKEKDLFVALKGESFDGHDFIGKAYDAGAALVLSEKKPMGQHPYILVKDALKALQEIARYYKNKFKIPFVAVTGSSGKTTTKDMIGAVLSEKYHVLKTEGNFNNAIGLPLTLLNLNTAHQIGIVEMGMNSLGEIARLADIVRPDIGVITNVGTAHIEGLQTRENILKAKLELFTYFNEENAAVINGDNDMLKRIKDQSYKIVRFGLEEDNSVKAFEIEELGEQGVAFSTFLDGMAERFMVPVPGIHNVYNALSAICVGHLLGMNAGEIREGLQNFKPSKMRMDMIRLKSGTLIINDVYNANPDSMIAAINVLSSIKNDGRSVCILGNMLELGDIVEKAHINVGSYAAGSGVDILITIGDTAAYMAKGAASAGMEEKKIFSFASNQEANEHLLDILIPGDVVLVKGSRGMKMEDVVDFLRERG